MLLRVNRLDPLVRNELTHNRTSTARASPEIRVTIQLNSALCHCEFFHQIISITRIKTHRNFSVGVQVEGIAITLINRTPIYIRQSQAQFQSTTTKNEAFGKGMKMIPNRVTDLLLTGLTLGTTSSSVCATNEARNSTNNRV